MLINEIITEAPSKGPRISGAKDLTKEFLIDDPVSGGKYKWRPTRGVFIDAAGVKIRPGSKLDNNLMKAAGYRSTFFGRNKIKERNPSAIGQRIKHFTGQTAIPEKSGVVTRLSTGIFTVAGRIVTLPFRMLFGVSRLIFGALGSILGVVFDDPFALKYAYGKGNKKKDDQPKVDPEDIPLPDEDDPLNLDDPEPKPKPKPKKFFKGDVVKFIPKGKTDPINATVVQYPLMIINRTGDKILDPTMAKINTGRQDFNIKIDRLTLLRKRKPKKG